MYPVRIKRLGNPHDRVYKLHDGLFIQVNHLTRRVQTTTGDHWYDESRALAASFLIQERRKGLKVA